MASSEFLSDQLLDWAYDSDIDKLLLAAINEYESNSANLLNTATRTSSADSSATRAATTRDTLSYSAPDPTSTSNAPALSRFAAPRTDLQVEQAKHTGIPKKTLQDTKYCVSLWQKWVQHREVTNNDTIPELEQISKIELDYWLSRFVLEVRKKNGSVYPPNTLVHLCSGIMRQIRWGGRPEIDIFKDEAFASFRSTLDAEMKRLQSQGIGTLKKQAEIITVEEEDQLWEMKILGDLTPKSLVDTMIFYNGLFFALRSGDEHKQLRLRPCQIQVMESQSKKPYLKYVEDISKNHPGGLKCRNMAPKTVYHHANTDNPERCFVRLFQMYISLCPADAPPESFYLRPLKLPTATCWYSKQAIGHSNLESTVARLFKTAGIPGYKTNHSLRATATSRLYQAGVDEQLVMERTGHRSVDGVRSYKRTSDDQRLALSNILNRKETTEQHSRPTGSSSSSSHGLNLASASFANCTINFNVGPEKTVKRRRPLVIDDSDSD